jgi:Spy/CpxP family protein refolding chaperone
LLCRRRGTTSSSWPAGSRYVHPDLKPRRPYHHAHTTVDIQELEAQPAKLEALSQEERQSNARVTADKLAALEALVEEKVLSLKKADRQLNAAKLLARQAKKEKENLVLRVTKLETDLAGRTATT